MRIQPILGHSRVCLFCTTQQPTDRPTTSSLLRKLECSCQELFQAVLAFLLTTAVEIEEHSCKGKMYVQFLFLHAVLNCIMWHSILLSGLSIRLGGAVKSGTYHSKCVILGCLLEEEKKMKSNCEVFWTESGERRFHKEYFTGRVKTPSRSCKYNLGGTKCWPVKIIKMQTKPF